MKIVEKLLWILDHDDEHISFDEKVVRLNIEFVHSLGLKCDCVGWSNLDLQNPRADEILSAIALFCKISGFKARGVYTRTYTDYTSDWYELVPTGFKENSCCGSEECESEKGEKVCVYHIRAYHELRPSPKWYHYDTFLVPERFRDVCIRHNINDVDFCWAKDKGKYKAEQYFHMYCNHQIPRIAIGGEITVEDKEKIEALGGYLPRISEIFYRLQQNSLQDCYINSDMPDSKIAHAYFPWTFSQCGRNKFLIHKNFAQILLREKAISENDLKPAMVVKEMPLGYTLADTVSQDRPVSDYLQKSISEYEKLKNTDRPLHMISEKDALKILRAAKKERKEDFDKAFPKAKISVLNESAYISVLPYYLIANGGYFSDEYEFLSYEKAVAENKLFEEQLLFEELLEDKPDGVVIAQCPDGDKVLLCKDGKVIRFSHEEPTVLEEWQSLAQFVADTING